MIGNGHSWIAFSTGCVKIVLERSNYQTGRQSCPVTFCAGEDNPILEEDEC